MLGNTEHELPIISPRHSSATSQTTSWASITSHIPPGQFIRYLLVGGWNTLFGYSTFALITYVLTQKHVLAAYMYAVVLSNFINITVAYLGYKFFVFKTKGNYLREWSRCMAVYWSGFLPGLILMPLLVRLFTAVFHFKTSAPYIANAILMGVGVIYSFVGHKKFSFRIPKNPD